MKSNYLSQMENFWDGTMCLFGGVRVPDGTISLFTVEKNRLITCAHFW